MWLSSLTDAQRDALLGLAHNVVVSDGLLDPGEESMMDEFRREMAVHPSTPSEYISLDEIEGVFTSRRSRFIAVLNLLRLSYSDGAFDIEEECLLRQIAEVFGITDHEFQALDAWVRKLQDLEAEANFLMHEGQSESSPVL